MSGDRFFSPDPNGTSEKATSPHDNHSRELSPNSMQYRSLHPSNSNETNNSPNASLNISNPLPGYNRNWTLPQNRSFPGPSEFPFQNRMNPALAELQEPSSTSSLRSRAPQLPPLNSILGEHPFFHLLSNQVQPSHPSFPSMHRSNAGIPLSHASSLMTPLQPTPDYFSEYNHLAQFSNHLPHPQNPFPLHMPPSHLPGQFSSQLVNHPPMDYHARAMEFGLTEPPPHDGIDMLRFPFRTSLGSYAQLSQPHNKLSFESRRLVQQQPTPPQLSGPSSISQFQTVSRVEQADARRLADAQVASKPKRGRPKLENARCSRCGTSQSSHWRRLGSSERFCNSCGLKSLAQKRKEELHSGSKPSLKKLKTRSPGSSPSFSSSASLSTGTPVSSAFTADSLTPPDSCSSSKQPVQADLQNQPEQEKKDTDSQPEGSISDRKLDSKPSTTQAGVSQTASNATPLRAEESDSPSLRIPFLLNPLASQPLDSSSDSEKC
eukprot:GILJ01004081.1.p1 GENE.GILJ01004081.1~~GILJ01004081.1.p1  ORF type:complete len:491 (+),score=36.46 GILJ01004081.1:128-1600(+)